MVEKAIRYLIKCDKCKCEIYCGWDSESKAVNVQTELKQQRGGQCLCYVCYEKFKSKAIQDYEKACNRSFQG